jgi:hypothetical protein
MTLAIADVEAILWSHLGEPAKPPTDYVVGFATPSGKLLAIDRVASETRVWFQPPEPPNLDGVRLLDTRRTEIPTSMVRFCRSVRRQRYASR